MCISSTQESVHLPFPFSELINANMTPSFNFPYWNFTHLALFLACACVRSKRPRFSPSAARVFFRSLLLGSGSIQGVDGTITCEDFASSFFPSFSMPLDATPIQSEGEAQPLPRPLQTLLRPSQSQLPLKPCRNLLNSLKPSPLQITLLRQWSVGPLLLTTIQPTKHTLPHLHELCSYVYNF